MSTDAVNPGPATPDPGLRAAAAALHDDAVVVDLHADTSIPMRAVGYRIEKRHRGHFPFHFGFWHCDLPRFEQGGVNGQFFGLVTFPKPARGCAASVLKQIGRLRAVAEAHPDRLRMAWSAADLRDARAEGHLAAFLGVEGAHNLEGDPAWVARFASEGVRYLGLAHFSSNGVAPCSHGQGADNDAPLPSLGLDIVGELARVGMIVDLAHVGRRAFLDAARAAEGPVIVSHTGLAGVHPHWRNLDDEQLRAVADQDGVVGVIVSGGFLAPRGARTVAAVVAHMTYVRDTVGPRHVALGSDFDGFIRPVRGLEDVSKVGAVTESLLATGWSDDDIRAALGENVLRVLAAHDSRAPRPVSST